MSFPSSARALIWQTCLPRFATFVSPLMSLKGLPWRRNDAAKDTDTLPAAGLPAPSTFSTFCSDPSASLTEPSRAMAFFASSMPCFASAGVQVARSAWFEFGPEGVSSKMLGCPAWLLEAAFLALGCAGVVLTWSTKPDHIEASAYLVSCEGIYYLTACVYYVLLGLPWAVAAYASMGAALCGLCLYRVGWYLPRGPEHYDKYEGLKAWQCLLACFGIMLGGKLVARAGPAALEADVAAFKDVRAHFFANGRAWTKGAAYPDGYNVSG